MTTLEEEVKESIPTTEVDNAGGDETSLQSKDAEGDKGAEVDADEGEDKGASLNDEDQIKTDSGGKRSSSTSENTTPRPDKAAPTGSPPSTGGHVAATGEPKVIKKGDKVITSYVDEKTGKIAVYEVGIKLEVSDFSQPPKWFPARVVDIDTTENEILVHFENWSTRFDEWIKMDSNRLRPAPNTNIVKTTFKVGEKVEAIWGMDGQKYPGEILSVLPNDYYQVLFDDGIRYKKKYNQIFKLKMATRGSSGRLSTDAPSMPPTAPPKTTRPLPKLTPAPFLLGNTDGNSFNQQPVSSLPPNVPLLANAGPKGKRIERQPSLHQPSPVSVQMQDQDGEQTIGTPQTSKSDLSTVASAPAELGKRRRTVKDYSQLLNPTIRRSPPPNIPSTSRRRGSSKVLDEKPDLTPPQMVQVTDSQGMDMPAKSFKTPKLLQARKSVAGSQEYPSTARKGYVKPGGTRKSQTAIGEVASLEGRSHLQTPENLPSVQSGKDSSSVQSLAEVTPTTSSGVSTPDTPLTSSKRKRTIHDYSMLLKSRIPRSFMAEIEGDTPPKTTRRRRKNITPNEQEYLSVDSSTAPGNTKQGDAESQIGATTEHEPEMAISDSASGKTNAIGTNEKQQADVLSFPKRTLVKQPPVLTEFDMFAPKKRNVVPGRNAPRSPDKTSKENSSNGPALQNQTSSDMSSAQSKGMTEESEEEELQDIPEYSLRGEKAKECETEPGHVVQPPPVVIRRPGRPFKKNKPPPGHWSYGISATVATTPVSTSAADNKASSVSPPKTSPGAVAHHPASRLMKNLKIPIVPLKTGEESNELLSGLSSTKIDKLQRKILQNDLGFNLEFEPVIEDPSVDVINCACGSTDEHGFMIQCEFCHCWQHGSCHGFTEDSEMPGFYVCETCRFPFHSRESLKNEWNQEYKRKGRLPRLTEGIESNEELEHMVLESEEVQDRLYQILDIVHSNRVKLHIANKLPEHPKIYQWDTPSLPACHDLKVRLYRKVYKPVLRRLLYYHRHEEGYKEHLIQQVERRFDPNAVPQESGGGDGSNFEIATDNLLIPNDMTSASVATDGHESSSSIESEVKEVLDDIVTKVGNMDQIQIKVEPPDAVVRPTELNLLDETEETVEKSMISNDTEKKGTTPLADDLSMLGTIGELKSDPSIDDLYMSILNDPDFVKSLDVPTTASAGSFTMKELMPAPPVITPVIVPTLERITPDMCRANLLNHVDDQQDLVDKCLHLVENKIQAMEEARRRGIQPTYLESSQLVQLQKGVKRLLSAFELLKVIPPATNSNSQPQVNGQSPGNENDPNVIPVSLRT